MSFAINSRLYRTVLALCIFGVIDSASATEIHFSCPARTEKPSLRYEPVPAGWEAATQGPLLLHYAGLMSGPPKDVSPFTADESVTRHGMLIETWRISGDIPAGKFLSCAYGAENTVLLGKRLDNRTTACTVTYARRNGAWQVDDIVCTVP